MFLFHLLFVLVITILMTTIFATGFPKHRTKNVLLGFFIILFFVTWAVGIWIPPIGSPLWGVPWISFLIVGLLFTLLLVALTPPAKPPRSQNEATKQSEAEKVAVSIFNIFFWILIISLSIIIAFYYI